MALNNLRASLAGVRGTEDVEEEAGSVTNGIKEGNKKG